MITEEYGSQLDALRLRFAEIYEERRRKGLPDYDILMAMAEDIGYDATGRDTKTNELVQIGEELSRLSRQLRREKRELCALQNGKPFKSLFSHGRQK